MAVCLHGKQHCSAVCCSVGTNMENMETGRRHVQAKGSGMALAASDGGQDCCRVSKARRGPNTEVRDTGIVHLQAWYD